MNIPNFQNPSGAPTPAKGKRNIRIAVFTILAVHVVLLGGLLMQGCDRKGAQNKLSDAALPTNAFDPLPNSFTALSNSAPDTNVQANLSTTTSGNTALSPLPTNTTIEPSPLPLVKEPPSATTTEYTIAKGDIFANIAKAKGVSLKALVAANPNVGATKLKVGQKIHIPAAPSAAVAGGDAGVADGAKTTTHVVKSGDTLAHIAKQHGTTIKAIQAANGLKTTRITIGQKLKLPAGKTTMAKADVGVPVKTIGNHPGSPTSTNQ